MDLNNIHKDIKLFVGNFSRENMKTHELGTVKAFSFKNPKIIIISINNNNRSDCIIIFNNKRYSETEFVKFLRLKIYW